MRRLADYPHLVDIYVDTPIYGQLCVERWTFPRRVFDGMDEILCVGRYGLAGFIGDTLCGLYLDKRTQTISGTPTVAGTVEWY